MRDPGATALDIHANECWRADRKFYTPDEEEQGEMRPGGSGTPLVLDLDGGGIPTTNVWVDPVNFDLDGDSVIERVGWIAPATRDSFLALDLNHNGRIDGGHELFGSATRLPTGGVAEHGFEALAMYDQPETGGNGDGRISSADSIWSQLLLWDDWNHDGRSQASEMTELARTAIVGLSLRYNHRHWEDDAGNGHFRMGVYWESGNGRGRRTGWIEDIIFLID